LALRKIAKHLTSAAQNHYIFDFMTIEAPFKERELETGLIHQLEKFLLELGAGFALVGRQHHLEIGCLQLVPPGTLNLCVGSNCPVVAQRAKSEARGAQPQTLEPGLAKNIAFII
jgi:hypothetical protein